MLFASAGHVVFVPSQVSTGSQAPADARHTTPAWPAGCWHESFAPSQTSSVQGLWSSVHAVPFGSFASLGQTASLPVQNSARSHSPAAGRHSVLEDAKASAGQSSLVPSQVSATSHTPAASRHTVAADCFASAGQSVLVPSQLSAASQAPAAARHTVPALPAGC